MSADTLRQSSRRAAEAARAVFDAAAIDQDPGGHS
jgi:hypothetical protein